MPEPPPGAKRRAPPLWWLACILGFLGLLALGFVRYWVPDHGQRVHDWLFGK